MQPFDYLTPHSIAEAAALLTARPEAVPLAGGTDLLIQMQGSGRSVPALVSLKRIPELQGYHHNGGLTIGAATPIARLAADPQLGQTYPALAHGAAALGSVQIRNRATVGGNLCNASPAADTAPALLVLGAQVVIAGPAEERTLPLTAFFLGPGRTALRPGELLKEIIITKQPDDSSSAYYFHTSRSAMERAVAGVAAALKLAADGTIAAGRLALGSVGPIPLRAVGAEAMLIGQPPGVDLFQAVGAMAAQEAEPIDDLHASAAYRRQLIRVLTQRALQAALGQAQKQILMKEGH